MKLFGESDFENELTALVTPKDSLGSVNTALDLYRELPQTQKEKLKADLSQNPPDSLSFLCQKVMDFQPKYVTEDYYFPLTVTVYEYNEYGDLDYDSDCELDGRFADDYADEIKAMFDAYTASDDTDMAEYFDGSNSAVAKIKSLKWDFESFDGVLFGRVRATLTEPLTEDEDAELKEFITGQNSDGLGEGAEQRDTIRLRRQKTGTPCAMQPPIISSPSQRISEWDVCGVKSFIWICSPVSVGSARDTD